MNLSTFLVFAAAWTITYSESADDLLSVESLRSDKRETLLHRSGVGSVSKSHRKKSPKNKIKQNAYNPPPKFGTKYKRPVPSSLGGPVPLHPESANTGKTPVKEKFVEKRGPDPEDSGSAEVDESAPSKRGNSEPKDKNVFFDFTFNDYANSETRKGDEINLKTPKVGGRWEPPEGTNQYADFNYDAENASPIDKFISKGQTGYRSPLSSIFYPPENAKLNNYQMYRPPRIRPEMERKRAKEKKKTTTKPSTSKYEASDYMDIEKMSHKNTERVEEKIEHKEPTRHIKSKNYKYKSYVRKSKKNKMANNNNNNKSKKKNNNTTKDHNVNVPVKYFEGGDLDSVLKSVKNIHRTGNRENDNNVASKSDGQLISQGALTDLKSKQKNKGKPGGKYATVYTFG